MSPSRSARLSGVAMGKRLDTDPAAWWIDDGRLYPNRYRDEQKKWLSDMSGHLKQANEKWSDVRD